MSAGDKAQSVARLRSAIAGIETPSREARGGAPSRLALAPALDAALGGGLANDALHEIAPAEAGDATAAIGFALSLAARFAAASRRRTSALLIGEEFCACETGALYGPGLAAHGFGLDRLVLVRAPDAPALLWAMEEALKSGAAAAVVGEIWGVDRHYGLAVSRRLLLAARAGRTPALLVLAGASGQAPSSAADARFEIAAAPSRVRPPAGGRLALPGAPVFAARLLKARLRPAAQGEAARGFDEERIVRLEWRSEERRFGDPTLSLPVVRAIADRSGARAARR